MLIDKEHVMMSALNHQLSASLSQNHSAHPVLCRCWCVCACVRAWCACAASASCLRPGCTSLRVRNIRVVSGAAPDGAGAATAGARQNMSRTIVLLCVPASWHSRDGAALPAIECRVPARDFRSPWLIGSDCTHLSTESPIHRSADPAAHRSIYPSTDLSPPRSEDAMFAAVCRLVRISRERRKKNCRRYEGGGECDDRVDWFISAAIAGGSPPPKTALRSRSCRRPSDIECGRPF